MIKLKDILKEGKETISDAHIGHIQAMLKRGFENEARWALAGGVGANKLEQAYRYVEKIDQNVFGRKGYTKETGKLRLNMDMKLFAELRKKYDTDSMQKINMLFNKMSKGY